MNDMNYSCKKLKWDSDRCSFDVYEILLYEEIDEEIWENLNNQIQSAKLVYIKNKTANRVNSKLIAVKTNAILYDTNISFEHDLRSKILVLEELSNNHSIVECSDFNWDITDLLSFSDSRFIKDEKLNLILNDSIYCDWITNSKNKDDKRFLIYQINKKPVGFILFKIKNDLITIELIAVNEEHQKHSIGTRMIKYLKVKAINMKAQKIDVGTQICNIKAINFYIKNGFSVKHTTDIYHWWR